MHSIALIVISFAFGFAQAKLNCRENHCEGLQPLTGFLRKRCPLPNSGCKPCEWIGHCCSKVHGNDKSKKVASAGSCRDTTVQKVGSAGSCRNTTVQKVGSAGSCRDTTVQKVGSAGSCRDTTVQKIEAVVSTEAAKVKKSFPWFPRRRQK